MTDVDFDIRNHCEDVTKCTMSLFIKACFILWTVPSYTKKHALSSTLTIDSKCNPNFESNENFHCLCAEHDSNDKVDSGSCIPTDVTSAETCCWHLHLEWMSFLPWLWKEISSSSKCVPDCYKNITTDTNPTVRYTRTVYDEIPPVVTLLCASISSTLVSSAIMTSLQDQIPPSATKWMSTCMRTLLSSPK